MPEIILKLKIDTSKLEKYLSDKAFELVQKISDNTFTNMPILVEKIKKLTRDIYEDGVMIKGLLSNAPNALRGQFGLWKGDERSVSESILDIIIDNLYIDFSGYTLVGRKLSGRLQILLSPQVYTDLKSANFAVIDSKGGPVEWIRWSLEEGDNLVVADYRIYLATNRKTSRSGLAVMIKAGSWRVPSEVSGTPNDNWITRELKNRRDDYLNLVQNALQKEFNKVAK